MAATEAVLHLDLLLDGVEHLLDPVCPARHADSKILKAPLQYHAGSL